MPSQKNIKILRPTTYTTEMGDEICKVITSTTDGLRQLCTKRTHWPYKSTIKSWRKIHPEFQKQYSSAKQAQLQMLVDEAIKIMGHADGAYILTKTGKRVINRKFIERAKLLAETQDWLMTKIGNELLSKWLMRNE